MAIFGNGPVAMISGLVVAAAAGGAAFSHSMTARRRQREPRPPRMSPPPLKPGPHRRWRPPKPSPPILRPPILRRLKLTAHDIRLAQNEPPAEDAPRAAAPASLNFTLGSLDDLRREPVASLLEKIDSIPDVAERTKVWTASADVASAPGVETFYHVKGPVTCGRVGCDLVVLGDVGGARTLLLDTVAEDVASPQVDTLVVNAGTPAEVTWVFDGAEFVEQR
ncbi:MAG: hypothetical protein R3C40_11455 [Parvularculaceae bacterium]